MGLKERIEIARRKAQTEQAIAAQETTKREAEKATKLKLQADIKARVWAKAQQKFDKILSEHQENAGYIKQIADLALTQITPTLQKLQNKVVGKYPYVDTETELRVFAPILVEFGGEPIVGTATVDGSGLLNSVWNGTSGSLRANLHWGRYPYQKYSRGIFKKEDWQRADYSAIGVYINFDCNNLVCFGDLNVSGTCVPFLKWQKQPTIIKDLINEAFSNPTTIKYDERIYYPPSEPLGGFNGG